EELYFQVFQCVANRVHAVEESWYHDGGAELGWNARYAVIAGVSVPEFELWKPAWWEEQGNELVHHVHGDVCRWQQCKQQHRRPCHTRGIAAEPENSGQRHQGAGGYAAYECHVRVTQHPAVKRLRRLRAIAHP